MIRPTLINLHPNEYSQGLSYYPYIDRCVGSCNTLDDLSNRVSVPNKTEDLSLNIFDIITGINESKILRKHITCKCECKFDGRKGNSNQKWNNDKCWCDCKNPKEHNSSKKDYSWNHATCSCENGKYLRSITDGSVITCDEIIEETKNYSNKNRSNKKYFHKFLYFTSFFINCHSIIDSFQYLPDKTSIKTKTFISISYHKN